jgi:adenosine deaminase
MSEETGPAISSLQKFIEGLPKVELHLHIEGTLEPELMFALARRNKVKIPFKTVAEVRKAYKFSNLQHFLEMYYLGMEVLRKEQDFYDLTWAYLDRIAKQNVAHVEIFFDPQGHTARGVKFETALQGIWRALEDGKRKLNVSSRLIMCFLRHLSEKNAFKALDLALAHKDKIVGVGLDSSEKGHPPSKFARVFARARQEGFLTMAHAGEEGPPEYVWQALDQLQVNRIDHGNRSLEDKKLVARLVNEEVALTVCPLSNLRLCVVRSMKQHPLRRMLDVGLRATLNSDDPAYFGGYINDNYETVAAALSLNRSHLVTVARNGIEASFLDDGAKAALRSKLDHYVRTAM